ncbi:MAG: hypothetical protein ACJ74O_02955 [Frankiaceae bacterium]
MSPVGFEDYVARLGRIGSRPGDSLSETEQPIREAATAMAALPSVDRDSLASLIAAAPAFVPALGLVVGLSHERLKNELTMALGSSGYVRLARERPGDVIAALDDAFDLVGTVNRQRHEMFTFADVLVARKRFHGADDAGRLALVRDGEVGRAVLPSAPEEARPEAVAEVETSTRPGAS